MEYRILGSADKEQYLGLRKLALSTHPDAFGADEAYEFPIREQRFNAMLEHPHNFIMGAFDLDHLVGMTGFVKHDWLKNSHKGLIWGMYLKAEYHGRGIGAELLEKTIAKAEQYPGLKQIHLGVGAHNEPAYNLYKKLGFKTYGTEPNSVIFDGVSYDEHLMVRMVAR